MVAGYNLFNKYSKHNQDVVFSTLVSVQQSINTNLTKIRISNTVVMIKKLCVGINKNWLCILKTLLQFTFSDEY